MPQASKRSADDLQGRCDNNVKAIFPRLDTGLKPGDYCVVKIEAANAQVLKGSVVNNQTSLKEFHPPSQLPQKLEVNSY